MNIAFFGLGNMGFPIAANLLKAGHCVTSAIHRNPAHAEKLKEIGGKVVSSPEEALKGAAVIFTIVPNDYELENLMMKQSMLEAIEQGSIIIDMTSASAGAVCMLSDYYRSKQVPVLDAPVSGGVKGASTATMTMICAGDKSVYNQVLPLLKCISSTQLHIGSEIGLAKKMKSINNLMSSANMAVMGEAWKIAANNGISPQVFYDVISVSSGCSNSFKNGFPHIAENDYTASFTTALMRKDVGLALELVTDEAVPIARIVYEYLKQASVYDNDDHSSVTRINFRSEDTQKE